MSSNAASKYANLPGIALDQPDIYETNDLPEADQKNYRPVASDPDPVDPVDVLKVAPTEAFKVFDGHVIDGSKVDFRNIGSGKGYQSWGEWEIEGNASKENETLMQKYHRVQAELEELLETFGRLKQNNPEKNQSNSLSGDLTINKATSHLESLSDQLKALNVEQWVEHDIIVAAQPSLDKLSKSLSIPSTEKTDANALPAGKGDGSITYELVCRADSSRAADLAQMNALEQKLTKLENLIGMDDKKLSFLTNMTNDKTITEAVNLLSSKVSQLDAGHLEQIDGRLTSVLQKLHQLSKSKVSEDIDRQNKLDQLHELLVKSDQQRATLPAIVSRLNSMAEVQEQASQFASALSYMESLQAEISESLKNNQSDLELVKETFDQNMDYLKQTLAEYDKRIQAHK
ncbi:Dynactin subunit 2 [Halotydeus destructor]|nr:Dynactin subunit 2 [Halotydeus destructor]